MSPDDLSSLGPAMRALNEQQRAFVMIMWERPWLSLGAMAAAAGYPTKDDGGDPEKRGNVLKQIGWRHAHNEGVIAAIQELAGQTLRSSPLMAVRGLQKILQDPEHKSHPWAIEMVLNRTGYGAVQKIEVERTDRTGAAMVERIKALAAALGVDAAQLLGRNAVQVPVQPMKAIEHDTQAARGEGREVRPGERVEGCGDDPQDDRSDAS